MNRIGVLFAMDSEGLAVFGDIGESVIHNDGIRKVSEFKVNDKTVYAIKSGVGEIAAASATQYLVDRYRVEIIINLGVVGALNPDLQLAEVVIVDSVVHYDYDVSVLDYVKPCHYIQFDDIYIPTDEKHTAQISQKLSLKRVICASADKFVGDEDKKRELVERFNADICEMEAAGIALTCYTNRIPCILIKSVSDKDNAMEFDQFLHLAVANLSAVCPTILDML